MEFERAQLRSIVKDYEDFNDKCNDSLALCTRLLRMCELKSKIGDEESKYDKELSLVRERKKQFVELYVDSSLDVVKLKSNSNSTEAVNIHEEFKELEKKLNNIERKINELNPNDISRKNLSKRKDELNKEIESFTPIYELFA